MKRIIWGSYIYPDSNRMTYFAAVDQKQCIVIDGEKQKRYDGILASTPIISSDGERVAYGALEDDKWFVVVDGEEQKRYDALITLGGGRIVFNEPGNLYYYLVLKGTNIYLVEERFKVKL